MYASYFFVVAADCKDRWKNIRGRYVKCKNQKNLPSGSRAKRNKDYYLTPHLHFLDSFLKSRKSKGNIVNETPPNERDTEHSIDEEEDVDSEKAEEEDSQGGDNESEINRSPTPSPLPEPKSMKPPPPRTSDDGYRKRKGATTLADVNEQAFKYFEKKQNILQQANMPQKSEPPDPDMAFLQSLLPDMKSMDESKKRKFKMGILKLADQLLDPVTSDCYSSLSGSDSLPRTSDLPRNIGMTENAEGNDRFNIGDYINFQSS